MVSSVESHPQTFHKPKSEERHLLLWVVMWGENCAVDFGDFMPRTHLTRLGLQAI
jgi:hypothetical protein